MEYRKVSLKVNENDLDEKYLSKNEYNFETEEETLLYDHDNNVYADGDHLLPLSKNKKNEKKFNHTKKKDCLSKIIIFIMAIIIIIESIPYIYKKFFNKEDEYANIYQETLYENANANLTDIKISVITSVYNTEEFVGRAIQSVLNQTLKEFELICIDDGSKDNSLKEILKFVNKDPRVRVLSLKKNGGQGHARNRGLKLARGEFLGFLDSDDEMTPTFYEDLYGYSKDYDVVMGKIVAGTNFNPAYRPYPVPYLHGYCGDSIWRRTFIIDHNIEFSSKRIAEDLDFRTNCYEQNPRIFNQTTEESYYIYRKRQGSLCNFSEENIQNNLKTALEYFDKNKNKNKEDNKDKDDKNDKN